MTPTELAGILAAFAAILGAGGWLARLGLRGAELKKLVAEADKLAAEAGGARASAAASTFGEWGAIFDALRAEVARLTADRDALEKRLDDAEVQADKLRECERECRHKLSSAESRVSRLEAALPLVLAGERIAELQDGKLAGLFDCLTDPLVITSSARDGMFLWVNARFAEVLQMTREEVLAAGWRKLIVPEDLPATRAVEGRAWDEPVEGYENRYRRKDGGIVTLRWYAAPYHRGVTIAIARTVGAVHWSDERGARA